MDPGVLKAALDQIRARLRDDILHAVRHAQNTAIISGLNYVGPIVRDINNATADHLDDLLTDSFYRTESMVDDMARIHDARRFRREIK